MAVDQFALARQCLDRALTVDPKAQYAHSFRAGGVSQQRHAGGSFAFSEGPRVESRLMHGRSGMLGLTLESIGNTAEALTLYEEAVRLEETTGKPHVDTLLPGAPLLLLLGRLDYLERWIQKALEPAPKLRDRSF